MIKKAALLLFSLCVSMLSAQDRGIGVYAKEVTGSPNFDIGKQYAVIIGIDRYQNWMPLKNAVADAKSLKRILSENYVIDEFIEMYDAEASAANIRKLFTQTLPEKVGLNDSLLIFYAGHGLLDDSRSGFWIPVDGSTDVLTQDRWIPNAQLRNYLGRLKAQRLLVVADSCFSGDLLNTSRGITPTIDSAYYKRALQMTSRQVLSSGASETVPDESEFARQLLSFLERNTEPMIDTLTIFERIRQGISQTLPMFGTLPGNENGASFVLFRKQAEPVVVPAKPKIDGFTLHITAESDFKAWARLADKPDSTPVAVRDGVRLANGNWIVNAQLPNDIEPSWSKVLLVQDASDFNLRIPALGYSVSYQVAGLKTEKTLLQKKLLQIEPTRKTWKIIGTGGWIVTGLGVALSATGYVMGTAARSTYDSATTANAATDARNQIETSNTMFQVGILGGSAGLITGLLSIILPPKKAPIERDLQSVDARIQKLEATR